VEFVAQRGQNASRPPGPNICRSLPGWHGSRMARTSSPALSSGLAEHHRPSVTAMLEHRPSLGRLNGTFPAGLGPVCAPF
jgi:hypothetical protein